MTTSIPIPIRDRQVAAPLKQVHLATIGTRLPPIRDRQVAAPLKRSRLSLNHSRIKTPIRDRQVAAPLKLSLFSLNEFPLPTEMGVSPQIQCLRVLDEMVQQTPEPKLDDELVAKAK